MSELCVAALSRKRAELAGEVRELERKLGQARADLASVDAVIVMFDPDAKPSSIRPKAKRRRHGWYSNGELPRTVLDLLREAGRALSVREVVLAIAGQRGFDPHDALTMDAIDRRVRRVLMRKTGLVEKMELGGGSVGYRLVAEE